jgi:hypothetical protein
MTPSCPGLLLQLPAVKPALKMPLLAPRLMTLLAPLSASGLPTAQLAGMLMALALRVTLQALLTTAAAAAMAPPASPTRMWTLSQPALRLQRMLHRGNGPPQASGFGRRSWALHPVLRGRLSWVQQPRKAGMLDGQERGSKEAPRQLQRQ